MGPPVEPVEGSAVDEGWELPSSDPELVPHWREAQHNVEVPAQVHRLYLVVLWQHNTMVQHLCPHMLHRSNCAKITRGDALPVSIS